MNNLLFKAPLVVGYKGEIGSFILSGLLRIMPKALDIWCFDINETEKERKERIKKADVIFLCVPIEDTIDWLIKYQKFLDDKIVIEQCSLKSFLYDSKRMPIVNGDFAINYYLLSMHVLFRPSSTPNKEDRRIAIIDMKRWKNCFGIFYERTFEYFTDSRIVYFNSIEHHDAVMALNQALLHRTLLILGKMLPGTGETYVAQKVKELYRRIKGGNSGLYAFIQKNKYLPEVLKDFEKEFKNFNIKKEMK